MSLAFCPNDENVPCEEPIAEGWGCGTYGVVCCHYVDYRCPGSSQVYRVWDAHPYWSCTRDLHGEYTCLGN